MRPFGVAVVVFLVCAGTGSAAVSVGATSCSVDFQARVANLDCGVDGSGVGVTLDGGISERVVVRGGETARFAYDALGRLVTASVGERTISYVYDDAGRLVRSVTSDGDTAEYDYDAAGQVTTAGGWRFAYSDQGLVRAVAPDGSTTEYTYDSQGGLVTADAGGDTARFVYGPQQRVIGVATAGETIEYTYDRAGEPVGRTDSGELTEYQYDRQRNLVRSADDRGATVEYDYDVDGSLLRVAADDLTTRFAYAANGRLVEARGPGGDTTSFAYDVGRLVSVVPEVGDEVVVSFEQGDLNAPVTVGYLWGDAGGDRFTLSARGRLATCTRCP